MQLKDTVHWKCIDDVVIILDALEGKYYGLDPDTSRTWIKQFALNAKSTAPNSSADQQSNNLKKLVQDISDKDWLRSMDSRNLLITNEQLPESNIRSADNQLIIKLTEKCPVLGAWLAMYQTSNMLDQKGFYAVHEWVKNNFNVSPSRLKPSLTEPNNENSPSIESYKKSAFDKALTHFMIAESFVPSRLKYHDCLPRSLGLYLYLKRLGFQASHIIGVQLYPFNAHAWVEYQSRPLLYDKVYGALTPDKIGDPNSASAIHSEILRI